jgi:chemotaxis signal transduction protein
MLLLAFTVGGDRYGVDVREVQRVLPAVPGRPVKGAPSHLAGIVDYHGAALTVVDLQAFEGGPPARASLVTRLIVLAPSLRSARADTAVIAECVDDVVAADHGAADAASVNDPVAPWRKARIDAVRGPLTLVSLHEWVRAVLRPASRTDRSRPGGARPTPGLRTGGAGGTR